MVAFIPKWILFCHCCSTNEIRKLQRFSNCSVMHTTASALSAVELIGNILNIFPGSGLYGSACGGGLKEIGIESCRKARAQFHDGYTVTETGKCSIKQVNIITSSATQSDQVIERGLWLSSIYIIWMKSNLNPNRPLTSQPKQFRIIWIWQFMTLDDCDQITVTVFHYHQYVTCTELNEFHLKSGI